MVGKAYRCWKCTTGASAIEFALIAPVFIYMIAALIGYGMIFLTAISLQQLGADASRATIGGLTISEKESLVDTHIRTVVREYALLDSSRVSVKVEYDTVNQQTIVDLTYDTTDHPIELFKGILPMPAKTFRVRQLISEHSS